MKYAKAWVAFAGAVLAVVSDVLADDVIVSDEFQTLLIGVVTAAFTYLVPNRA